MDRNAIESDAHMIDELEKITDAKVDWQQLKQPGNYLGVADKIIADVIASCESDSDVEPQPDTVTNHKG